MRRCPSCHERLPADPARRGARCPHCRDPLYEEREPRRRDEVGSCAAHPGNPAADTCPRCGNYACAVCRTRWRDRWLCAACVDRALDAREAVPGEAAAHLRQAVLGLIFGALSWGVVLVALVIGAAATESKNIALIAVAGLLLMGSPLPAVFGVGQAAAAIRTRGDHMILATIGLVLSGLHVGTVIGLIAFSLGQN